MKHYEIPDHYEPPSPWVPDDLPDPLINLVAKNQANPSVDRELVISKLIWKFGKIILRDKQVDDNTYRAAKALERKAGNCMARAEIYIGIGKALGLDMFMLWDSAHASALWSTEHHTRYIDYRSTEIWKSGHTMTTIAFQPSQQQRVTREVIGMANGRGFIDQWGEDDINWQPILGSVGDETEPYLRPILILPDDEGVMYLAALGDRTRYQDDKPDTWEAIGAEIERLIPQPFDMANLD